MFSCKHYPIKRLHPSIDIVSGKYYVEVFHLSRVYHYTGVNNFMYVRPGQVRIELAPYMKFATSFRLPGELGRC